MRRTGGETLGLLAALAALWGCSTEGTTSPQPPPAPSPPQAGVPVSMAASAGQGQVGFAGRPVEIPPAITITDGAGNPVAGVSVTFTPFTGAGTVTGGSAVSDASGVARVESWRLGSLPGPNRLRAQAIGLPVVTFVAIGRLPPTVFDVLIRFNRGIATAAQGQAFKVAEGRWESVLTADLTDTQVTRSAGFCGAVEPINELVDDLLILVNLRTIDGPGGVLASAGPCLLRQANGLPVVGTMNFDTDDLPSLEANGTLDDVILHEMGHVLGIGSLWGRFGLLADSAAIDTTQLSDPHFIGPLATVSFDDIGGAAYTGDVVPVEDQGGAGTRLSHWRESVFDNELMTGFIDPQSNPMSEVTVSSLADMGYDVDPLSAESFFLDISSSESAFRAGRNAARLELPNDVLRGPLYVIDAAGRIRRLFPRDPGLPR